MIEEKKFLSPERFRIYSPKDLSQKWFVEFYLGKKRFRKYGKINSQTSFRARMTAANELLDTLIAQAEEEKKRKGQACPVKRDLVANLYKLKKTYRERSFETFKSKLNRLFIFANDRLITKVLVEDFFTYLSENRHPTTYHSYHQQLKKLFSDIGKEEFFNDILQIKDQKTPAKYFSREQISFLKEEIQKRDYWLWRYIEFIYYCFIRPYELRQLTREDIYLSDRLIRIRGAISKNKKTEYVAIPSAFNPTWIKGIKTGYIFQGRNGNPIGRNSMTNKHRELLKELGISSQHKLYSWKHTGAVMAVKAGIGLKQLQVQLRHSSLEMTDKYLRQMGVNDLEELKNNFPKL